LCKLLAPTPRGPIIIAIPFCGVKILVDPVQGKGLEEHLYYFGVYEAGTLSFLKTFLRPGDIFLDVGANIGLHSCVASHFVGNEGKVYAIEPHPETYKILKYNIYLNRLTNITAFQIALGSKNSTALIYDNPKLGRGSASLSPQKNANLKHGRKVKVKTIDTLIERKLLPIPNLVKIDVEGFELEVLKGARKLLSSSKPPILCIEYSTYHHQYGGVVSDIHEFVTSINNYSCYKLRYGKEYLLSSKLIKISKTHDLPHHDNVFYLHDSHLNKNEARYKYEL